MYKNIYINDNSSHNKNKKTYSKILKLNSNQSSTNIQKKIQSAKQNNTHNKSNIGIKIKSGRRIRSAKKYNSGKRIRSGKRYKIEIGKDMIGTNSSKHNEQFNKSTSNKVNIPKTNYKSSNKVNIPKTNYKSSNKVNIPKTNYKSSKSTFFTSNTSKNNNNQNLDKFFKKKQINTQNLDKFVKKNTNYYKNTKTNNKLNKFFNTKKHLTKNKNSSMKKENNILKLFKNHALNDEINIKLKMNKNSLEKLAKLNIDNLDLELANKYLFDKGIIKSDKTPEFIIKYLYKEHGDNFIKF